MVKSCVVGFCVCMGRGAEEEKKGGMGEGKHGFRQEGTEHSLVGFTSTPYRTKEKKREEGWSLLIRGNGWGLFGCHLPALACFCLRMIPIGPLGRLFKQGGEAMMMKEH